MKSTTTFMGSEIKIEVQPEFPGAYSRHIVTLLINGKKIDGYAVDDTPKWAIETTEKEKWNKWIEDAKQGIKTVVENWENTKDIGGLFEEDE